MNKNSHNLHVSNKEKFFHNLLVCKYPNLIKYKDKAISYAKYYSKVIKIINRLNKEFNYKYKFGNPFIQYKLFSESHLYTDDILLMRSINQGDIALTMEVIKRGVNIHIGNDHALRWASYKGYLDIVKYLVKNGADIHANNDEALKWAIDNGHTEVVRYLMKEGVNKNKKNVIISYYTIFKSLMNQLLLIVEYVLMF